MSPDAPPPGAALTARLEEVPGVAAAAVHIDESGVARSIRIAALDTPPLEQIRAGVQDVLDSLGIRAGADAVRIGVLSVPPIPNGSVSAGPPPTPDPAAPAGASETSAAHPYAEPPPWHGRFLLLDDLDVRVDRTHCRCRIDLIRLADRFDGQATDLATEIGRARAAARATLAAARKAAPGVTLALEGIQVVPLFGRRYIALTVEAAAERRFHSLSGLVAIEHSVEHAAAAAALRAIERWIAW